MPTRGQIAREAAAFSNSTISMTTPVTSDAGKTTASKTKTAVKKVAPKKSRGKKAVPTVEIEDEVMMDTSVAQEDDTSPQNTINVQDLTPVVSGNKRKRAAPKKKINGEVVSGGWDELPHNMGSIKTASPQDSTSSKKNTEAKTDGSELQDDTETLEHSVQELSPKRSRKSRVTNVKNEDDANDQKPTPNSIEVAAPVIKKRAARGKAKKNAPVTPESSAEDEDPVAAEINDDVKDEEEYGPKKKRVSRAKNVVKSEDVEGKVDDLIDAAEKPAKKPKKGKKNPYGLTPGETPFPGFPEPTPEACQKVNDLLANLHGEVKQPEKIPAPSLEVSGCGEVPSVLDAMIRTLLSAATSGANSSRAFQGLIEKYGKLDEGIGKGSVNWYKVRESPLSDVFEAIKSGGLAKTKSQRIKEILDLVYTQNIERRDAFIKEKDSAATIEVAGARIETQGQKDLEIAKADSNILSLDHLHALSAEDAMVELTKYPGIGVKTASCVILFCMQRPSFAVDTHVWRLCKWLKWVPEGATRDQTFSHCEVRVPDHLKYPLHQLFIRHGKTCGRCRANTGTASEDFLNAECPIDGLVVRTGKRKDESTPRGPPKKKGTSAKKRDEWDSEIEEREDTPELEDDVEGDGENALDEE